MPLSQNASRTDDSHGSDHSPASEGEGREHGGEAAQPAAAAAAAAAPAANANVPKPKRLACMICRKRKLKCDGIKPSCSTCARLGHSCAYDEVRRKSGPKRGYVKALEERLKLVESLLSTPESASTSANSGKDTDKSPSNSLDTHNPPPVTTTAGFNVTNPSIAIASDRDTDRWQFHVDSPSAVAMEDFNFNSNIPMNLNNIDPSFTWEMIGLGLEEPLPPQETIDELHQIFFEKIHPTISMIHKFRYLAAMNLAPNQRPPVALRYAVWTLACSVTDKYAGMTELFYQRARKYVEADYIKGYGEHMISVAHAQTHVLIASYEFKMMYFPRAWMSTGSAVRLAQMIGLHRLDGAGLDVKQCLPPPRDWTETEERRRTFWMAFTQDRYASIGTGWPMTVDERDIMTNLPASEEAFEMSRPETTLTLAESMSPAGAAKLSSFGGIVLMACLFGRNLVHLHRLDPNDRDHDHNGEFWKRHRNMDNILLNTSLCLPSHLKLPNGLSNPNIVFTNMNIHTSTICLHQAAIFKADKHKLPSSVSAESKVRCITAANEIASIMRMISHMDLCTLHPFISFCLYVSARVFVQYLKSRPDDSQVANSLRFLLSAMDALKRKNPLTESFLVQLDVDLEALCVRIPKLRDTFPRTDSNLGPVMKAKMADKAKTQAQAACNGLPAYRDECSFSKKPDNNNGPPVDRPDAVNSTVPAAGALPQTGFDLSSWLTAEQPQDACEGIPGPDKLGPSMVRPAPTAARQHNMPNGSGLGGSLGSSPHDLSVSPRPDSQSNRHTPNSSSTSERQTSCSNQGRSTGRTSFDVSPSGVNMSLGTPSEMDAATAAFFSDAAGFDVSGTGMTPGRGFAMNEGSGADFGMGNSWEQPTQPGMTPVAEGVLRNLMSMTAMDAMDLGWDGA